MDLGLLFTGGDLRITELVHLAREAEAAGFDSLCVAEAWRSAFVPLTAMAATEERESLRLRHAVDRLTAKHAPAKLMATGRDASAFASVGLTIWWRASVS